MQEDIAPHSLSPESSRSSPALSRTLLQSRAGFGRRDQTSTSENKMTKLNQGCWSMVHRPPPPNKPGKSIMIFQVDDSPDLVVVNQCCEVSPVLGQAGAVRQTRGVVPGPHLPPPDARQEESQQHHPPQSGRPAGLLLSQSKYTGYFLL